MRTARSSRSDPTRSGSWRVPATSHCAITTIRPSRRRPSGHSTASAIRCRVTSPATSPTARSRCSAADRCPSTPGERRSSPRRSSRRSRRTPDVFDTVVVGVPDDRYGNRVAAVVAARDGHRPALADINAVAREQIAGTSARAASGSSTRSSVRPPASPTTAGVTRSRRPAPPTRRSRSRPPVRDGHPDRQASHAHRTRRSLRHRVPDLRIHPVRARGRGHQPRRRASVSSLRPVQRDRRTRPCPHVDAREHRRETLRRRHRHAGEDPDRGHEGRPRRDDPDGASRVRRAHPRRTGGADARG